jgi:hypothetical protein
MRVIALVAFAVLAMSTVQVAAPAPAEAAFRVRQGAVSGPRTLPANPCRQACSALIRRR